MPRQKRAMPASPMPERGQPTISHGSVQSKNVYFLQEHVSVDTGDDEQPSTSAPTAEAAGVCESVDVEEQQLPQKQKTRIRQVAEIILHSMEQLSGRIAAGFGMSPRQMDWYKNCWSQPVADRSHLGFFEPRSKGL